MFKESNAVDAVDCVYRTESRRVLATLIRLLGDFDRAEEAMQEAFATAVERWPSDGVPTNPRAWLVSTARFRAIDALRRRALFDARAGEIARQIEASVADGGDVELDGRVEDDQLRLIFTCCHPAIAPDAQIALTLREVCGLTTEEIAAAFLTSAPTIAQRIVRAKQKIRDAKISYELPARTELAGRLDFVLHVIYLVYNEGYYASSGASATRADLSQEAVRLGRLLLELLPFPEVRGLLALMLLNESRRASRTTTVGDLILLEDQDRTKWDANLIAEGIRHVEEALRSRGFGPFTLQATIAAVHAEARSYADTDWPQIVALYDLLLRADPSPVIELNRAVAVAIRDGAEDGLALVDSILERGDLRTYHLAHVTRADLLRRLGRHAESRDAYRHALTLSKLAPEQRYIERQLELLEAASP
jgi:RNA polymerase sigma-70 factor, ECF subfamily